jgi:hypothetical protein
VKIVLDTIGLLTLSPRAALLELINSRNDVQLQDDWIAILNPTVVSGRETEVTLKVRKSFDPFAPVPFQGETKFTYNRLDITEFFMGAKINLTMPLPTTTSAFLEVLTNEYGYVFDSDDFYEDIITVANAHGYRLRATPRSLRWIGEYAVNLMPREDLELMAKVTDLGSLNPVLHQGRPFVTHNKPFTDGLYYGSYLKNIRKGVIVDGVYLASIMGSIYSGLNVGVGKTWTYSPTAGPKNLYGAQVKYNGHVEDIGAVPYNKNATKVLIIELNPTLCTDVAGTLVIYYNSRINVVIPEFPIVYKQPAELLGLGQVHGHSYPAQIVQYPSDYEFKTDGLNIDFLNTIYRQENAVGEDRFKCVKRPSLNNLYGAKVLFNGYNRKWPEAYNVYFGYIWVIQLNEQYCTNLRGNLLIHYNLSKL